MPSPSPSLGPVHDAVRVASLLDIVYTDKRLLADFGPPPPALDGYVTFFDPGWSILRLREAVKDRGEGIFYPQNWYDAEAFANAEAKPGYRQLRMEAVPDSFRKWFSEQQTLLTADEEVPPARVVIAGMVIHFLATGERFLATVALHDAHLRA